MERTDTNRRLAYLLCKYSQNDITLEEKFELFKWMESQSGQKIVNEHIEHLLNSFEDSPHDSTVDYERIYQNVLNNTSAGEADRQSRWKGRYKLLIAASFAILLGIGYYIFTQNQSKYEHIPTVVQEHDIAPPATVHAVLTLSDGQQIVLDSLMEGVSMKQGKVKMVRLDNGNLTYLGTGDRLEYNTMTNPKGSKVVSLTLSDGTRVWLNSASQLKYPTSFVGSERRVEVEGEAYFEVAHKKDRPFIVSIGNTSIHVLGTSFNVKAYEESSTDVTLLEGSIDLSLPGNYKRIPVEPGQQVCVTRSGTIQRNKEVDLELVMAWKNGHFLFKGTHLQDIMRDVSRWYNVQIVFEKPIEEKFYADVPRNTGVAVLLQMLEATKAVDFRIEGQKIIVTTPK